MSIRLKLLVLPGILTALTCLVVFANAWVLQQGQADGLRINLAGRQRMLSQRMTKELLHLGNVEADQKAAAAAALQKTTDLFDRSLTALLEGGTTKGAKGTEQSVPAATEPAVSQALREGQDLWRGLRDPLGQVVRTAGGDASSFQTASALLLQTNMDLLRKMNEATVALQRASEARTADLMVMQWFALALAMGLLGFGAFAIKRSLADPMSEASRTLGEMAEGKLVQKLDWRRGDELGQLAQSINHLSKNTCDALRSTLHTASDLERSAQEVLSSSTQLTESARQSDQRSGELSSSSENLSHRIDEVQNSSRHMSEVFNTLASAVEEMSSSIAQVSRSTESSAEQAGQVSLLARDSETAMDKLGEAAAEIGRVIETIDEIAEQTNMLALNATIEAARAGEAGKGFAVVAGEVKELANATSDATEDIRNRITGIQESTGSALQSIKTIVEGINSVREAAKRIALSVSEQREATDEIARNLSSANQDVKTVVQTVEDSVRVTQVMNSAVHQTAESNRQTVSAADANRGTGQSLVRQAEQLRALSSAFQID